MAQPNRVCVTCKVCGQEYMVRNWFLNESNKGQHEYVCSKPECQRTADGPEIRIAALGVIHTQVVPEPSISEQRHMGLHFSSGETEVV